jgi:hypothetical protein
MVSNEPQLAPGEKRLKNLYLQSREDFEDFLIDHAEKIENFPLWIRKYISELKAALELKELVSEN